MNKPLFEEAKKLSQEFDLIPVSCELSMGNHKPIEVLKKLKARSSHCFLLESAEDSKCWGRYTLIGFEPTLEITCINGNLTISGEINKQEKVENPSEYIKNIMEKYKSPNLDYLPPFTGGLVGYFAYDYIKYSEKSLKLEAKDEEKFNDVDLMLFDKVIVFDNLDEKIYIIVNVKSNQIETNYPKAVKEIEKIKSIISKETPNVLTGGQLKTELKPLFTKEEYCEMVEKAKKYIYEGDIFQVVLSNRLEAEFEGSLIDTYSALRNTNPSPYMFYFGSDQIEMAGASPETLVKLENGILHTFPLAGTRKRGADEKEDKALEEELLSDQKELAEHNMLVDLGRNDLGKISEFGSVEVESYKNILRFSHVMHIGSTVKGTIRKDKSAIDAIEAVLPAGTLSGAPKIRACEIINELENNKRGVYGGAVGYLDFKGNMDTCIAIRLCFKKNGKIFVRSGAGIVADSVAVNEYEECLNKARAVINALNTTRKEGDIK